MIKYKILKKEELEDSITGHINKEGKIIPAIFESPKLHYFNGFKENIFEKPKDHFFVISYIETSDKYKIIGLIELASDIVNDEYLNLRYITVDSNFKKQGIGTNMVEMLAKYLNSKNVIIKRSAASEEGLKYIQTKVDSIFNSQNLKWIQEVKTISFEPEYRNSGFEP